MQRQPKPQIQIDSTFTVLNYSDLTKTFYIDFGYEGVYQASTIDRLVSDLRWAGKSVKLFNPPDDRKIDVCYIFAWQPDHPDSEKFWIAQDEKIAAARVEQLKIAHPHFVRWRLEPCRIDLESWRMHRLNNGLDYDPVEDAGLT
jgi:hypothetical protein